MRWIFISLPLLFLSITGFTQSGYKININVKGLRDTTAYLGFYYGESTLIKDTARVNSKGEFFFDGQQNLPHGVYFLVLDKTRIFEFVVSANQHFSLGTNTTDYVKNMIIKGDTDNKLFFENMLFNMERHKEAEPYLKTIQDSTLTDDQKKNAREAFAKINDKVLAYQDQIIAKHPNTVTAKLFKTNKTVKIPDPPKKSDGSIDSTFQLRWYREHFFDYFDLADDTFIRMPRPVYQKKINEYLDKLFVPQADTLTKAINFIISKAKKNKETYTYAVRLCMIKYQTPEIMGLDEVYVNLFDTYIATGEMDSWVNNTLKKNLKDHVELLRKSLIGRRGANLIMMDSSKVARSMYDIKNKYTILYFFDPDCGACKEETPKLVGFYNKKKFDVEVYAVSADSSMAKMKAYIKEMNLIWITVNGPRTYVGPFRDLYDSERTPTLYVLDNTKKIIGKKIPAEKLEEFLLQHERIEKNKALKSSK